MFSVGLLPIDRLPVCRSAGSCQRQPIRAIDHASVTISFCSGPVTVALASPTNMLISVRTPNSWRVDAGFDREPRARDQAALVVRLVVVHVDAVAVHALAEAVAGAVDELRAEAGAFDHVPRRRDRLRSRAARARSRAALLHELDRRRRGRPGRRQTPARTASGTARPVNPTQVMSAKTAPGAAACPRGRAAPPRRCRWRGARSAVG